MSDRPIRYFDRANRRLVYVRREADSGYWDEHWRVKDEAKTRKTHGSNRFYLKTTMRHLPQGARILEGGCGLADKVFTLQAGGFETFGVDFAQGTIHRAKRAAPELKLAVGDIRSLGFPEAVFDGYWSIGAIEHFYSGYGPIAAEMRRVLRTGAYLFVSFPVMSPLCRLKASMRAYAEWPMDASEELRRCFYQFALPAGATQKAFEEQFGFRLVARAFRGGVSGLREEVPQMSPLLDPISKARRGPLSLVRKAMEKLLPRITGRTVLLILRKV